MGLLDSHVTDEELEDWKNSEFVPLGHKVDKLQHSAGKFEGYVKDHGKQHEEIKATLKDQANELCRAFVEIAAAQVAITSGFNKLEFHLNNLGERLSPLFREHLTQIDAKLNQQLAEFNKQVCAAQTEFDSRMQKIDAKLNKQLGEFESRRDEIQNLHKQACSAQTEFAASIHKLGEEWQKRNKSLAELAQTTQTHMEKCQQLQQEIAETGNTCHNDAVDAASSAKEIAAQLSGCNTFFGRLRWLLRGPSRNHET